MAQTCRYCSIEKPLHEFTKNKTYENGYATICLACARNYQANKRTNRDFIIGERAKKFNTTPEHIRHLFDTQLVCQICNKKDPRRSLAIDHCHKTGIIRGLLCDNCNKALGCFKDSIENLENAIKYLKEKYK